MPTTKRTTPNWGAVLAIAAALDGYGLNYAIEDSNGKGGFHIWVVFDGDLATPIARGFGLMATEAASAIVKGIEVNPKQASLTDVRPFGNWVRLPGRHHTRDHWSRFYDREIETWVGWPDGLSLFMHAMNDADDFNARIAPTIKPAVDADYAEPHGNGELPPRVAKAITSGAAKRRWEGNTSGLRDPSRSGVAMSLACALVELHIPTHDIEAGLRHWCDLHGAGDKANRDDWVRRTTTKAHDFVASRNGKGTENSAADSPTAKSGPDALADTWRVLTDPTPVPLYRVGPGWLRRLPQGGLVRGRADVIGGQPGIGKSALANVIATETLRTNSNARVVIALTEMNARQFLFRTIARLAGVPLKWLYAGIWPNHSDMDTSVRGAREAVAEIADRLTFLEPPVSVGVIRRCVEDFGATILVVDYLQLVRPDQQQQNRRDAVDAVLAGILGITHRYSTATLIMASVNRNQNDKAKYGAGRDFGSFKESGNIEFSADSAFLLEPDEKFTDEFTRGQDGPA